MATIMYSYIQKNMARYEGDEIYTLTPDELRVKVMESRNVDISELTSILVSKAYGEEDVDISLEGLNKCLAIFL